MQIHELNNFTGTLGAGAYLAIDDGTDTGKVSTQQILANTEARIDNIIAGDAPSAAEVTDARYGADGVTYTSLGTAIRTQVSDLKADINEISEDTKNLWSFAEPTIEASAYKQIGVAGTELLPAGTYTISALITSDVSTCSLLVYSSSGNTSGSFTSNTGNRVSATFTIALPIERIYLIAGSSLAGSAGHTATFSDIQIESGNIASSYIKPVIATDIVARNAVIEAREEIEANADRIDASFAFMGKGDTYDYVDKETIVNGYLNTTAPPSIVASNSQLTSDVFYVGIGKTLTVKVNSGYRVYLNYYDYDKKKQSGAGYFTSDTTVTTTYPYLAISITKNPYSSSDNISVSEKSNVKVIYTVPTDAENLLEKVNAVSSFPTRNKWTNGDINATGYIIIGTVGVVLLPKGKYTVSFILDAQDAYVTLNIYGSDSVVLTKQITPSANRQYFQINTGDQYINRFYFVTSSGTSSTKTFSVTDIQVETNIWSDYQQSDSSNWSAMPYCTDYIEPYIGINEKLAETHSRWEGKKIVYNGDSITQGIWTADGGARTGYAKVVNKALKFGVVDNFAIGGTRLAHVEGEADCMVDRITDMSTDGDIVFIMANTNDYASQVPIGSADSTDISTYNGALNTIFTWLKNNYKQQPIIISTMLTRKINYDPITSEPLPITIEQYAQAVRDRVADYHFILYDAYNWSGLDLRNSAVDNTGVTNDNLHPNMYGAQLLGQKIASFIEMQ